MSNLKPTKPDHWFKTLTTRLFGLRSKTLRLNRRSHTPVIESLETRQLLSGVWVNQVGGDVYIYGSQTRDHVEVTTLADNLRIVEFDAQPNGSYSDPAGTVRLDHRGFSVSQVNRIFFLGYGGNDTFRSDAPIAVHAFGYEGEDLLIGGPADDFLYGDGDNDLLIGQDGNDMLHGGADNDRLYGESGEDMLFGIDGNDELYGGRHDDRLFGNTGNDILRGGDGDDELQGGKGEDWSYGGPGQDFLYEQNTDENTNHLFGQEHDDRLYAGSINDELDGGTGNNTIIDFAGGVFSRNERFALRQGVLYERVGSRIEVVDQGVRKFQETSSEASVYYLKGTDLYVDDTLVWKNVRDFALDESGTQYQLSTSGALIVLDIDGVTQRTITGVAKFEIDAAGAVHYLSSQSLNVLDVGIVQPAVSSENGVRDFAFDADGNLYLLTTTGFLGHRVNGHWEWTGGGTRARGSAGAASQPPTVGTVRSFELSQDKRSILYLAGTDLYSNGLGSFVDADLSWQNVAAFGQDEYGVQYNISTSGVFAKNVDGEWITFDQDLIYVNTEIGIELVGPGHQRWGETIVDYSSGISASIQSTGTQLFLNILGTSVRDEIIVRQYANWIIVDALGLWYKTHPERSLDSDSPYDKVFVNAGGGNDTIRFEGNDDETVGYVAFGEGGDDTIYGSQGRDIIIGGVGQDTIFGRNGNDNLTGDNGQANIGEKDIIFGGKGNDTISGDGGNDILWGDDGDGQDDEDDGTDIISGGEGADEIWGEGGLDALYVDVDDIVDGVRRRQDGHLAQ